MNMDQVSNDWWPKFSDSEYRRRFESLRAAMDESNLDALAIYGAAMFFGTDPGAPNLAYLSAYAPGLQGYVVFPRQGDPMMAIYVASHLANARRLSVLADVRAGTDLPGLVRDRLNELGLTKGRIGIVGNFSWSKATIPYEHHEAFKAYLPDAAFEPVTEWYEELRLAKSDEEIQFMQAGAAICDRAFDAFRRMAAPGVTDVALHNEALRVVHAEGGRIPMRDPSMNYPDFYSPNRVLQHGDVLMTELTGGYGGYFGKIYTTSFIGPPTAEYRLMFELAADRYRQLLAAIAAGKRGRDFAGVLSGQPAEAGYKSLSFITGWSTYNSRPVLFTKRIEERDWDFELRPGYCLNVAGWIVSDDETRGVWTGDTVVVTEDGVRRLHASPVDQLGPNILTD